MFHFQFPISLIFIVLFNVSAFLSADVQISAIVDSLANFAISFFDNGLKDDVCGDLPRLKYLRSYTRIGGDDRSVYQIQPIHVKCLLQKWHNLKIIYENRHLEMAYLNTGNYGQPFGFIEFEYDDLYVYQDLSSPDWYYFKFVSDEKTEIHRVEIGGYFMFQNKWPALRAVEIEMGFEKIPKEAKFLVEVEF